MLCRSIDHILPIVFVSSSVNVHFPFVSFSCGYKPSFVSVGLFETRDIDMTATSEVHDDKDTAPELPDYATNYDAVLGDEVQWRYGKPPDYSQTRKFWADSEYTSRPFPAIIVHTWQPRR